MKKTIIMALIILFIAVSFLSAAEKHSYKPEKGYVPDQGTVAIKLFKC